MKRREFKDNHGRTWIACNPGDAGAIRWNIGNNEKMWARIKSPGEENIIMPVGMLDDRPPQS